MPEGLTGRSSGRRWARGGKGDGAAAGWTAGAVPVLSDREFARFSALVYELCGIKLPPVKRTMLSARLQKRLRELRIPSFAEYLEYVLGPEGRAQELHKLIDVVSTNKTDFFREPHHFEVLRHTVLPEFGNRLSMERNRRLAVWSAGCSSGQEPYTLAMVLEEFRATHRLPDYGILASDICTEALAAGREAVYADEIIAPVPAALRHKYLMKGKGHRRGYHRVVPELRRKVEFRRINFMDRDFGIRQPMDIIFCRNVIIYFDRQTQRALFEKFYRQLAPGGYLFTGHSESLEGIADRMERVDAAVYRCRK